MSFHILAVDTTGKFGSIALSEGGRLLEEVALHSPEGFGHVLFDGSKICSTGTGWLGGFDGFASAPDRGPSPACAWA